MYLIYEKGSKMKEYKYIIVGGGMTGSAAVMGIRENDPEGSIAMFSKDRFEPYNRPPLTKALWKGGKVDDIMRPMEKYNIDLYLETSIKSLKSEMRIVEDKNGERYTYEKLLLATGGHPNRLPDMPEGIIYYRTLADYEKLHALAEEKQDFGVIGAGFIGSEIAAGLTMNGKNVTMIFPEIGIAGLIFPDDLSKFMSDYYREKGVKIQNGYLVQSVEKQGDRYKISAKNVDTDEIKESTFDAVIIGVGIRPNIYLAEEAGLAVDNGIIVDEFLQTDNPDIFAAGDVANFFNPSLGKRTRVEHEDNANNMGERAGKNMSGEAQPYNHFPFFYSDEFDMGYEAVGELNKKYEIFEDWIDPYKKGAVIYLEDGKVRGAIFWNLWGKVDQGRKVIAEGKTYTQDELKGLFTAD
jgi:3-phenylpropionate/trans-cinnamate dioxygenase ferredoxin reductase subunit